MSQDDTAPEKDISNSDPFSGAGGYAVPKKVNMTYTLVFDTEDELKTYHHYLRLLKKKYPNIRTIGSRVSKQLVDEIIAPLEAQYGKAAKKSGKTYPVGHEPHDDVKIVKESVE